MSHMPGSFKIFGKALYSSALRASHPSVVLEGIPGHKLPSVRDGSSKVLGSPE